MTSSFFQIGHLHVPLFGVCAALGVVGALLLSQVTARLVRLDPAKVWDAGVAMTLAALVISRVLLVVGSWRSFLMAPLEVLGLPALNDTGVLLTAAFLWGYLWWKGVPVLQFLDAMGPCFALVWAAFNVGDLLAGTRDGMPTATWLGVSVGRGMKVHPVEFYSSVCWTVVCGALLRLLSWLARRRAVPGLGLAGGLVLGGAAVFLLDFLRVPSALYGAAMLDPGQWLGLVMGILGGALYIALPSNVAVKEEEGAHAI